MILRLILGDQLNIQHSWFTEVRSDVVYTLMEVRSETDYVAHHIQKIAAIFLAMRAFAEKLGSKGHKVEYFTLDHPQNQQSFLKNIIQLCNKYPIKQVEYQEPDEYRVDKMLAELKNALGIPVKMVSSEHFLADRNSLAEVFAGKKMHLLETYYRHFRKKYNILLDHNGQPIGGRWNYDAENRQAYPKNHVPPAPLLFHHKADEIVELVKKLGITTIGHIPGNEIHYPINRQEALELLEYFAKNLLAWFGTFQDAMHTHYATGYHSRLSFALNIKILHPLEVISRCVDEWESRPDEISLSQIEGFVRQILGWREYMRAIYWARMPEYAMLNFFNHTRPLPSWYWTGKTRMNCLRHAIGQSLSMAYAHHIQRLMVTGNFALLAGCHPDEVDRWYLGIYIDAFEWVEITNTRGMSQFADGGIVGTKPYVSSANYIRKMSNYCDGCYYNPKMRYGERACPFNSLFWHFYSRNRSLLEKNPRIGMMYQTWDKMEESEKNKILNQAESYLHMMNEL
ncbi:cryptochrome/photolyase family protein [Thermaurantimonas aggregans]|uniref:Cryptochrome/photolyase family protein n=1 Tax=Thermaurantimonas aggregans TaxID=2173829 RepID=A0A401XJP2_9FLAO|nr:cryptochrome/photolyase family protein [Thermaurantimonas aggregans]MCX8148637.1 cryptochrome/photolyase family protein [Thermaurantimonas aggregans]GCD77214.1 cryptochrome/photolyase family protein [Thermaurantimonas aggregans]